MVHQIDLGDWTIPTRGDQCKDNHAYETVHLVLTFDDTDMVGLVDHVTNGAIAPVKTGRFPIQFTATRWTPQSVRTQ